MARPRHGEPGHTPEICHAETAGFLVTMAIAANMTAGMILHPEAQDDPEIRERIVTNWGRLLQICETFVVNHYMTEMDPAAMVFEQFHPESN